MTRFRILSLAVAVLVIVASSYAIRWVASDGDRVDASPSFSTGVVDASDRVAMLDRQISDIEAQLAGGARSAYLNRFVGRLYLEKARITDDLEVYADAERTLADALALQPGDPEALTLLAKAAMAYHDFDLAIELVERALDIDPTWVDARATLADASVEIGEYSAAAAGYDELFAIAGQDPSVLVRLARQAFLDGDPTGALSLAQAAEARALETGGYADAVAFYQAFLADLALDSGDYGLALAAAERSMDTHPGVVSHVVLAAVETALGNHERAIELYEAAVLIVDDPASLAALGDLYTATGEPWKAAAAYARAEPLLIAGGTSHVRERVQYLADHDLENEVAVVLAETELAARQDIHGYDAYAWALFRAGRFAEAREASDSALRLGTLDAELYFHAGMISAALGDNDRAIAELEQALAISPAFDPLLVSEAAATLAELA